MTTITTKKKNSRKEARKVYEKHFGKLPEGWHVHHTDGNPFNNDPWNLLGCSPEKHHDIHFQQGDTVALRGKLIQFSSTGCSQPGEKNGMYGKGHLLKGKKNGMYGKDSLKDKTEEEKAIINKKRSLAMKGKRNKAGKAPWNKGLNKKQQEEYRNSKN